MILGITSINYGGGLVGTNSYLDISLVNSQFTVQTSTAFAQYEEYETALSIYVTITFSCTGGTSTPLVNLALYFSNLFSQKKHVLKATTFEILR